MTNHEKLRERALTHLALAELHIAKGSHVCPSCKFGVSTTDIIVALLEENQTMTDMLVKEGAIVHFLSTGQQIKAGKK